MFRTFRSMVVALVATSMIPLAAPIFAQDPGGNRSKAGQAPARKKAAAKRPPRRKPRGNSGVGLIVPYPFPPALIIRQTPEAHDEIQALLNMLRYQ